MSGLYVYKKFTHKIKPNNINNADTPRISLTFRKIIKTIGTVCVIHSACVINYDNHFSATCFKTITDLPFCHVA